MKCYGLTLQLRDDPAIIATYKEHHRHVWPEVLAQLRAVGIQEMRIFLLGRRMFMYIETTDDFDPATDFARRNASPVAEEWDRLMSAMQERVPEAREGEWWAMMEQVFDLNWPQHRPPIP